MFLFDKINDFFSSWSIPALPVSERSLNAAFNFTDNIKLLNFLAISSVDAGLFW